MYCGTKQGLHYKKLIILFRLLAYFLNFEHNFSAFGILVQLPKISKLEFENFTKKHSDFLIHSLSLFCKKVVIFASILCHFLVTQKQIAFELTTTTTTRTAVVRVWQKKRSDSFCFSSLFLLQMTVLILNQGQIKNKQFATNFCKKKKKIRRSTKTTFSLAKKLFCFSFCFHISMF